MTEYEEDIELLDKTIQQLPMCQERDNLIKRRETPWGANNWEQIVMRKASTAHSTEISKIL